MAAAAALPALALAASSAAAERVQTRLTVRATVLPACIVTTAPHDPSNPAVDCTHGERPTTAGSATASQPPALTAAPQQPGPGPVKLVTLTY